MDLNNLHMSESSRKFLKKHYPEFFNFTSLGDALWGLDDFIVLEGLDENDDMTRFGHEAQDVYDDIYMHN